MRGGEFLIKATCKTNRIGEISKNKYGSEMVIIEYISNIKVKVKFLMNDYITYTSYQAFKRGLVKNPLDKSVYDKGFFGIGIHKSIDEKKEYTKCYKTWHKIHQRCYSEYFHQHHPAYKDCIVDNQWHNYQVFAEWFEENYYEIDGERMEIDKDILFKGNRIYSPETSVFVPQFINTLFTKTNKKRGSLPIGVHQVGNKFVATCLDGNKQKVRLGSFLNPEEAFYKYKEYKESVIKGIANSMKDKIPLKLYKSLMSYEVEITD